MTEILGEAEQERGSTVGELTLPDGGPHVWPMWREPSKSSGTGSER